MDSFYQEGQMKIIQKYLGQVLRPGWHKILQDPRRKSERSLEAILTAVMKGMLGGCRNLRSLELKTGLNRIPDTTIWDLLVKIDPTPLSQEIARGVKEAARSHEFDDKELPINLVVIDGKSVSVNTTPVNENSINRSQKGCKKYVNMVLRAFYASSSLKLHLGQHIMPKETNECGAFPAFVDKLIGLYGRTKLLEVISVDAAYTSKANARYLVSKGIKYILALKKSHLITQSARALLGTRDTPDRRECEKVNGKLVTRSLYRVEAAIIKGWESATEFWRVDSQTEYSNGKVVEESRYFVTSIAISKLSDAQVLRTVRRHWNIENNANWVLDTAWQEDRNPWCNKALELVSLLRLLAYNAIARLKFRRLRAKRNRAISWRDLLDIVNSLLFPLKNMNSFATL
jgi:predicted transposase YbfD/YdcC